MPRASVALIMFHFELGITLNVLSSNERGLILRLLKNESFAVHWHGICIDKMVRVRVKIAVHLPVSEAQAGLILVSRFGLTVATQRGLLHAVGNRGWYIC